MINEIISNFKSVGISITNYFTMKLFPTILSPLGIFLFGVDHIVIIKALFLLVVIDFITGIWAAYYNQQVISSRRAVHSAYKVVVYALLVAGAHLTSLIIPVQIFTEEIVSSFLAATELISIIENAGKLGFSVPQKLLNKLHEYTDEK